MGAFTRPHLVEADPETCFLEQGLLCMGPATRGGCGNLCVNHQWPCRGCYGPTPGTPDTGAAMAGVLASLLSASEKEGIEKSASTLEDPLGTLYQFTMAHSLLKRVGDGPVQREG